MNPRPLALALLALASSAQAAWNDWSIYVLTDPVRMPTYEGEQHLGGDFLASLAEGLSGGEFRLRRVTTRRNPRDPEGFVGAGMVFEWEDEFLLGGDEGDLVRIYKRTGGDDTKLHAFALQEREIDWLYPIVRAHDAAIAEGANAAGAHLVVGAAARIMAFTYGEALGGLGGGVMGFEVELPALSDLDTGEVCDEVIGDLVVAMKAARSPVGGGSYLAPNRENAGQEEFYQQAWAWLHYTNKPEPKSKSLAGWAVAWNEALVDELDGVWSSYAVDKLVD